jgi:predicted MPP superfamily phosphohydrolase
VVCGVLPSSARRFNRTRLNARRGREQLTGGAAQIGRRGIITAVVTAIIAGVVYLGVTGWRNAIAPPAIRRLTIDVPRWRYARPLTIVFFADVHAHGPDMPPSRIAAIVETVNDLHPDIVVSAGDFVGGNFVGARTPVTQAVAPLAQIRSKFGFYAVLGNHDYDAGGANVARALERVGAHVLVNQARRVGPIALGGIDGRIRLSRAQWAARRQSVYRALDRTPGLQVLVAHRPDEFEWVPDSVVLTLAGHTHCGQIVLPLIGPLATGSDFGTKYLCGVIRHGSKTLVVTAGIGTSRLPVRINAPSDIWVITLIGR